MDGRTQINEALASEDYIPATAINDSIADFYAPPDGGVQRPEGNLLDSGDLVCGKYVVEERLDVTSGEADLYLCSFEGKQYVAKIYRREIAIKEDVVDALLKVDSPNVARLYESSTHNGYPVEVSAYYKNGSLQGKQFSLDELVRVVIPGINAGLHALHEAMIIHKDLKPSNVMLSDDGESVAIIDFGISSVMSAGSAVVVTRTGMTPEYSAPETFRNLFLEESDYYSFGVTVFELFCGYTPYANMSMEEIEQYVSLQRIPLPEDMPPSLQGFISALTYYDISARQDKGNPNRRWTYDEVASWLNGAGLAIPGEGAGKGAMPPYVFVKQSYTDTASLAAALATNWKEGKHHLFRGLLTAHFRSFDQQTARYCQEAEDEAARANGKDDVLFFRLLYRIHPRLKGFYWNGVRFESLPALGRDLLERLWNQDATQNKYYESILKERLLSQYVAIVAPKNENLRKAASGIEDMYVFERNHGNGLLRTFYIMAYTLSGQKLLNIYGQKFRTVGEFAAFMREELGKSLGRFEGHCHDLVSYYGDLDVQLEAWLIAIGKQKELDEWKKQMEG
ncbi:MAG: protein kinase [Clostridiales Family XIII bacterium]|jgi:hypothetical protein|nr:protein kinase [Clostridiales Family XIII bacterium]